MKPKICSAIQGHQSIDAKHQTNTRQEPYPSLPPLALGSLQWWCDVTAGILQIYCTQKDRNSDLQVSTKKKISLITNNHQQSHLFSQSHDQKAKPSNGGSETPSHSPQLGERSDIVWMGFFEGHKLNLKCKHSLVWGLERWNCCDFSDKMIKWCASLLA